MRLLTTTTCVTGLQSVVVIGPLENKVEELTFIDALRRVLDKTSAYARS